MAKKNPLRNVVILILVVLVGYWLWKNRPGSHEHGGTATVKEHAGKEHGGTPAQ